ncbi:6-bladed beta-propeller [Mucilaginibacter sp. 44-25]|uniref:6-bladed beta-propeller n=1 Tax=Mucilaginibacter sp. 44-25 TaxID=1895794 RepID=UPI00095F2EA4|nr:6-bladed beta-propeller [Mucilaginibacter sp. 44-25]OJW17211.1 MAG: hypothetical protein BGO48_06555 [Mucilaginibacter sp. 44-25]
MSSKKIRIIIFLLFTLSANSCILAEKEGQVEKIKIIEKDVSDSLDVTSHIAKIQVTKLQETPGSYIGEPYKLIKTNKNYIVFDKLVAKRIVVFDLDGKFVKNVIELGKGKNEALQLNDCWLDSEGHLEIYDFSLKEIFVLDDKFEVAKIIIGEKPNIYTSLMNLPHSKDFVGYKGYNSYNPPYMGEYYKVAILDSSVAIKKVELNYKKIYNGIMVIAPTKPFINYLDTIRFAENFNSNIYNVTPKGLTKRYELQYDKPLPTDFYDKVVQKNLSKFKAANVNFTEINSLYKGYNGYSGVWLESKDFILFQSFDDRFRDFLTIYDKRHHIVIGSSRALYESVNYKTYLPTFLTTDIENNKFLGVWSGYILKSILKDDSKILNIIKNDLGANYLVDVQFK